MPRVGTVARMTTDTTLLCWTQY